MPKLIVTSRYIKPNAYKRFGNYIKYIATREGVEKPVQKQGQHQELDREIFMKYLNSRPNSHGLFTETDKPLVLDKVAKAVAEHNGAIWTHIVSLKREDAERMGYTDLDHWRNLVRRRAADIAAAQKIAPENFRWYAAFHNKETNPHVHIVVYSADGKQGYLTKAGIEKTKRIRERHLSRRKWLVLPHRFNDCRRLEDVQKHREACARRSRKSKISSARAQIQTVRRQLFKSLFRRQTTVIK